MPINHVQLRVTDLAASKAFYLAALAPLGYKLFKQPMEKIAGLAAPMNGPDFWLLQVDGEKVAGTTHVAFDCKSTSLVDAIHKAAVTAGAKSNGAPGFRPNYTDGYYAAFFIDPLDGYNIEAVCFCPWWIKALGYAPAVGAALVAGGAWWAGKAGWF